MITRNRQDNPSDLNEAVSVADQVYTLTEGGMNPLGTTLADLASFLGDRVKWALVGGLAVGLWARPRGTQDVDICLLGEAAIDEVARLAAEKFTRTRPHALTHKGTGVEVELLTPEFVKGWPGLFESVIETATVEDIGGIEVPVASREGLVASKLGRLSFYDKGDIAAIVRAGGPVDLNAFNVPPEKLAEYRKIEADAINQREARDD